MQSPNQKPLTYAEMVNAMFNQKDSVFESLQDRFDNTYDKMSLADKATLEALVEEFRRRFPNIKFEDLGIAEAGSCTLAQLLIDDTMQRQLDWDHLLTDLLSNFSPTMVMPINVYVDVNRPNEFVAWDGQHTAIMLYIIAVMVYGLNPEKVFIPINKFKATQKNDIRKNFIELNGWGKAKKKIEPIDYVRQMIFAVRVDGATDTDWVSAEKKQALLEGAGLFMTAEKFKDHKEPGAVTGVDWVLKYPETVIESFCWYWIYATQKRAVELKEMRMVCEYFLLCEEQDIKLTKADIKLIATLFKDSFATNFKSTGPFWAKIQNLYDVWYKDYYKKIRKDNRPDPWKMSTNGNHQIEGGLKFIIALLEGADVKFKLPTYRGESAFQIEAVKE